jgi:hypothetical protein
LGAVSIGQNESGVFEKIKVTNREDGLVLGN